MASYKFGITGKDRKKLAGAISGILNTSTYYQGTPTFVYEVGGYRIEKDGAVTGEYDPALFAALRERGFEPIVEEALDFPTQAIDDASEDKEFSVTTHSDLISIEYPLDGFLPEAIGNLRKMVTAKETLLKKALGMKELPIEVLEDRICFCWFPSANNNGELAAYNQFIIALCLTAKEKKRVTAKAQESYENESFSMRVWLIGLGMIGEEFKLARKLLMANLSGDSAWRHGKPESKVEITE